MISMVDILDFVPDDSNVQQCYKQEDGNSEYYGVENRVGARHLHRVEALQNVHIIGSHYYYGYDADD